MNTDRVSTSTYQPRIRVSISKAHDVARSAGHWKRKLRTRNGASVASGAIASKTPHRDATRGGGASGPPLAWDDWKSVGAGRRGIIGEDLGGRSISKKKQ